MSAADKIVVCFRMPAAGMRPGQPNGYLPRARVLAQRAEALGATLSAWSAMTVAFAFETDALEEAVDLVVSVVGEAVLESEKWACGIAQGAMEPLNPSAGRADLSWGEALVLSLTLARVARAGEVLVGPSVTDEGALRLLDARVANDGGVEVRGHRLDAQNPWRRRPSLTRMPAVKVAEPLPSPAAPPARREPSPTAPRVAPAAPALTVSTPTAQLTPTAPRAAIPAPVPPPIPAPVPLPLPQATSRASFTSEVKGLETPRPAPPPSPAATQVAVRESRAAFLARDRGALERTVAQLEGAAPEGLAGRMRAFVAVSRGDTGQGLRVLEAARANAQGPARVQAGLSLAIAHAAIGHLDEALLEGLDALARAREHEDARAVDACTRFLNKLVESRAAAVVDEGIDVDIDVDVDAEMA